MNKYLIPLLFLLFSPVSTFSQNVKIQIVAPKEFMGRKAILLTREKGFAAIVHSIKLNSDIFNLEIANDLVPDLYQLHISQVKGSLLFFSGIRDKNSTGYYGCFKIHCNKFQKQSGMEII